MALSKSDVDKINAIVQAAIIAAFSTEEPAKPETPTETVSASFLPGRWAKVTPKTRPAYRTKVPTAKAEVGEEFFGVLTDKPNVTAHHYVVAVRQDGTRFYNFSK